MSLVAWLAQPAGRALTLALFHFVWQGLLVAIILAAVVELGGIRRAALRYACSFAALVAMTACPFVTLAWLSFDQQNRALPAAGVSTETASRTFDLASTVDRSLLLALSPGRWSDGLQPYALAAWFAGVLIFGSRLLAGVASVSRLRRGRLPLPAQLAVRVERLGRRLRMNAAPLVFLSRHAAEAMAVGLVRPLVLIPAAWATEMPLEMLEAVIAHELAHLRRRDLWVILLQRVVETVLFYHPAVWWLSRRLRIERELCADDLAVAATEQRLVYAQTLEQVAQQRRADGRTALAAFVRGEKDMRLLQRVRNVLGQSSYAHSRPWPAGVVALALPVLLWAASPGLFNAVSPAATADERAPAGAKDPAIVVDDFAFRIQKDDTQEAEEGDRTVKRRAVEARNKSSRERTGDASIEELTALVRRLAVQVESLQAQVAELRGEKEGKTATEGKPAPKRKTLVAEDPAEPKTRVRRLRVDAEIEQRERAEADEQRAIAELRRAEAEAERAIAERKRRAAGEGVDLNLDLNLDRKIRTAIEQGREVIIDKEAIRRAVEQALEAAGGAKELGLDAAKKVKAQALEAAEKGIEQAREAAEKAKEQALEAAEKIKEQAREAAEKAKEQEIKAQRAKEEARRREEEKP